MRIFTNTHARLLAGALGVAIFASAAQAQILPPVPERTPDPEPYTPPPPPPPPPPRPEPGEQAQAQNQAERREPPQLARYDDEGRLIKLTMTPAEAAARAVLAETDGNEEQRAKLEELVQQRRTQVDQLVIANLANIVELRTSLEEVDRTTDIGTMRGMAELTTPFRDADFLARTRREGALDRIEVNLAQRAVDQYKAAVREDVSKSVSHQDIQGLTYAGFIMTMDELGFEPLQSLRRMMDRAFAEKGWTAFDQLALSAAQRNSVREARGDAGPFDKPEAWDSAFYNVLDTDQQRALLLAANPQATPPQPDPEADADSDEKAGASGG